MSTEWQGPGKQTKPGLPDGLALSASSCGDEAGQRTRRWTLAGPPGMPAGAYTISASVKLDEIERILIVWKRDRPRDVFACHSAPRNQT